jgi:hypothetical protein
MSRGAPQAEGVCFSYQLEGLTKGLLNGVDGEDVVNAMAREIDDPIRPLFQGGYDHARFLEDIGELAAVPGLRGLVHSVATANTLGFRYELEAAAFVQRTGLEEGYKVTELGAKIYQKSDVDMTIANESKTLYVQVKSTTEAFYTKKRNPNTGEKLNPKTAAELWMNRTRKTFDIPEDDFSQFAYVVPSKDLIPGAIDESRDVGKYLDGNDVTIFEIEHLRSD